KKHALTQSPTTTLASNPTLTKAKEILGCTSVDSCKAFCALEANRNKCTEFAKAAGLKGGEEKVGPGGCLTETSCKLFCLKPENASLCAPFKPSPKPNMSELPKTSTYFSPSPTAKTTTTIQTTITTVSPTPTATTSTSN